MINVLFVSERNDNLHLKAKTFGLGEKLNLTTSRGGLRDRGTRGRQDCKAPKLWNAKTTNSGLGRARKSLGATDVIDLNDRRHNKLLPSGNKVSLRQSLVIKMGEV